MSNIRYYAENRKKKAALECSSCHVVRQSDITNIGGKRRLSTGLLIARNIMEIQSIAKNVDMIKTGANQVPGQVKSHADSRNPDNCKGHQARTVGETRSPDCPG
jgi:hypothetical protein